MNKALLIVIYNHKYDKNINLIEQMYQNRFSSIFHIIPFYDGSKENVLTVYESSFYFSGYIAQAYNQIEKMNLLFDHCIFIADDMILNPLINEENYFDFFHLTEKACYISNLIDLTKLCITDWPRCEDAFYYNPMKFGVEIKSVTPKIEEASSIFSKYNIKWNNLADIFFKLNPADFENEQLFKEAEEYLSKYKRESFAYPLAGGYSDLVIVASSSIKKFALYCGAFAATDLFVEVAIPTSLILSSENIITELDTQYKTGALWPEDDFLINYTYKHEKLKEYITQLDFSLNLLLSKFPDNYLFVHPIKLSKWNYSI